jgi:5-methylthioadenosine/S-adenosylhomocysteine deaminase
MPLTDQSKPPQACDSLVTAAHLITLDAQQPDVIEHGAIAFSAGKILAAGLTAELLEQFVPAQRVDLGQHILLPGLVNTHGHAAMTLLRGLGDGNSLQTWLENVIWPLERDHISNDFVRDGTDLALAEMLRSGTTCFSDMYFMPQIAAQQVQAAGMRAQLAFPVIDVPNAWSANAEAGMSQGLELYDSMRHEPLVNIAFGPHSTYTLSRDTLSKVCTYADEMDARIEIHLHENAAEVSGKQRPIALLQELGMLNPRLQAVHMTQLLDQEIELLAQMGVQISHCPSSNMKLASGRCPVGQLQVAGINVGLGTDGAASNDALDMLQETRQAVLLARLGDGAQALTAKRALQMATIDGARVLGLDQQIGSLEPGKAADMIAVDSQALALQPLHDPIAQLIHCAGNYQVSDAWVAGRRLLSQGELLTLDQADIVQRASRWRERLQPAQPLFSEPSS